MGEGRGTRVEGGEMEPSESKPANELGRGGDCGREDGGRGGRPWGVGAEEGSL